MALVRIVLVSGCHDLPCDYQETDIDCKKEFNSNFLC